MCPLAEKKNVWDVGFVSRFLCVKLQGVEELVDIIIQLVHKGEMRDSLYILDCRMAHSHLTKSNVILRPTVNSSWPYLRRLLTHGDHKSLVPKPWPAPYFLRVAADMRFRNVPVKLLHIFQEAGYRVISIHWNFYTHSNNDFRLMYGCSDFHLNHGYTVGDQDSGICHRHEGFYLDNINFSKTFKNWEDE